MSGEAPATPGEGVSQALQLSPLHLFFSAPKTPGISAPGPSTKPVGDSRQCHYCKQVGHFKAMCPKRQKDLAAAPKQPTVLCVRMGEGWPRRNYQSVRVGQRTCIGKRDSGAELTLVRPNLVSPEEYVDGESITLTGFGGTKTVPIARVFLDWGEDRGTRRVGVWDENPVDVLLGEDLGFEAHCPPKNSVPPTTNSGDDSANVM